VFGAVFGVCFTLGEAAAGMLGFVMRGGELTLFLEDRPVPGAGEELVCG